MPARRRGVRLAVLFAGLPAALGIAAVPSPVAMASSSPVLNWAQQAPAASPFARSGASMAYDAATGNVVLFGGIGREIFRGTWVWDGSNWTRQHPATRPSGRYLASMTYDAATGNVVLFGGVDEHGNTVADTWVWTGSNWARQAPATSPRARYDGSAAYDAATRSVVLFGGNTGHPVRDIWLRDTWVWGSGGTAPGH